ncbi:MAG: hypothetical protein HXY41_01930 [Chloroflexi bacterium]|nr:hypothetical protein [Chloroflexota bacterium]
MLFKAMAILAAKFARNRHAKSGKDWRANTVKYHASRAEWEARYHKPDRRAEGEARQRVSDHRAEWEARYRKPEARRRG